MEPSRNQAAVSRALAQAATLDPQEPLTAQAHAQAALDAGMPAAALFAHAYRLAPGHLSSVSGWPASLALQGEAAAAEALLRQLLTELGAEVLPGLPVVEADLPGTDAIAKTYAQDFHSRVTAG